MHHFYIIVMQDYVIEIINFFSTSKSIGRLLAFLKLAASGQSLCLNGSCTTYEISVFCKISNVVRSLKQGEPLFLCSLSFNVGFNEY